MITHLLLSHRNLHHFPPRTHHPSSIRRKYLSISSWRVRLTHSPILSRRSEFLNTIRPSGPCRRSKILCEQIILDVQSIPSFVKLHHLVEQFDLLQLLHLLLIVIRLRRFHEYWSSFLLRAIKTTHVNLGIILRQYNPVVVLLENSTISYRSRERVNFPFLGTHHQKVITVFSFIRAHWWSFKPLVAILSRHRSLRRLRHHSHAHRSSFRTHRRAEYCILLTGLIHSELL